MPEALKDTLSTHLLRRQHVAPADSARGGGLLGVGGYLFFKFPGDLF